MRWPSQEQVNGGSWGAESGTEWVTEWGIHCNGPGLHLLKVGGKEPNAQLNLLHLVVLQLSLLLGPVLELRHEAAGVSIAGPLEVLGTSKHPITFECSNGGYQVW